MTMETSDLILGKARYEDWKSMYRNVWSRPETARYMLWNVTADEEEARRRMQRTVAWQATLLPEPWHYPAGLSTSIRRRNGICGRGSFMN